MIDPKFSVLLPTHNRANLLPIAIKSILAQTQTSFELLIVGDGCTDNSAEVVRNFADERIRWFDLPKAAYQGYANRNAVLRQARGELIAYMQDDDLWLPDHLELLGSHLERRQAELAFSRLLFVSLDGIITARIENLDDPLFVDQVVARKVGISMTSAIHRRSCFDKYGYMDDQLPIAGEMDLWARFIEGGHRQGLAYLPAPTCFHFRTKWRGQTRINKLRLKSYRLEGSLPPELIIPIPSGISAQAAIWQKIDHDPIEWTDQLRRAVQVHLDRLASAAYPSTLLAFMLAQYKKLFGR
jgi:glycosyltransferase involved in cell wall biosynthesis